MANNYNLVKELMKKTILLAFILCAFATVASAQVFTSSATITISRKSDGANGGSQNKADQALKADIERYVVGVAGSIVNPTAKDEQGNCLPFRYTLGKKTINIDIYNRDASTCAVAIVNGKVDLRSLNALSSILNRPINTQFNFLTDANFVQDAATMAAKAAEASANNDASRTAEKVDPPQ